MMVPPTKDLVSVDDDVLNIDSVMSDDDIINDAIENANPALKKDDDEDLEPRPKIKDVRKA